MTEKEQKNTVLPEVPAQETGKDAAMPTATPHRPHTSKGEVWYNRIVYQGINYWVNLISSIAIADYFTHNGGRKNLDNAINTLTKSIAKTGILDLKTAHHHSKIGVETAALTFGGWLILAPMKIMEDRKRPIVHWLNKKLGVNQTAPDGHEETADEIYIEKEQPKQNWGKVVLRRIGAMGAVIVSGMALNHLYGNKAHKLPDKTYDLGGGQTVTYEGGHLGGKQRLEENIQSIVNKGLEQLPYKEVLTKKDGVTQRWLGLAALDTFFTAITAIVMKVTNGAKKAQMPHEIGDEIDPPADGSVRNKIHFTHAPAPKKNFAETVGKRAPAGSEKKPNDSFVAGIANQETAAAGVGV